MLSQLSVWLDNAKWRALNGFLACLALLLLQAWAVNMNINRVVQSRKCDSVKRCKNEQHALAGAAE